MAEIRTDLSSEIDDLKRDYDCKVIENIGSFRYIVTVFLEDRKVSVKFQLTDEYPNKRPEVVVKGLDWSLRELEKYQAEHSNFSITEFLQFVVNSIKENRVLPGNSEVCTAKMAKKKTGKRTKEADDSEKEKKVSMRTAEDVIKRIKWDSQLNPADFTVGYLDRFLGVVENNFMAFNWDDLASVDYSDTAIPKHRIHYFKYKNVVVWDKTKRLDNVFGSTGSCVTIVDVINNYDDFEEMPDSKEDEGGQGDIEIITSLREERSSRDRPNYFICQKVKDERILSEIGRVQEQMISNDKSFGEFMVPPERVHMTLCTLGLRTEEEVVLACCALEDSREELAHLSQDLRLELKKVDQFFNRVVYCRVMEDARLETFVDHLKLVIREKGLQIADAYDFVPHVTLMKVARDDSLRTIPRRIYAEFEETEFGSFSLEELSLCEISKAREEDGFYKCRYVLTLG